MSHGVNDTRLKDALAEVREIGRTQGEGGRALPKLYGKVLHWAADGVIDTAKSKHGKGIDDISLIYDDYAKSVATKAGPGVKSLTQQKSKMRSFVKVGEMTTLNPPTEFDRMAEAWRVQAELDADSVRPESQALLKWATEQLAHSDGPLGDEHVKACVMRDDKEEKTVADVVEGVRKKLEKLMNGDAGCPKCIEAPIVQAHEQLRGFLQMLETQRETDELLAKAEELGLTVVREAAE